MSRKWLGTFVRHEYTCDFCGGSTTFEYDSAEYEKENYVAPNKEKAPEGWLTGTINNTIYYFDSQEHKNGFIDSWTRSIKAKF